MIPHCGTDVGYQRHRAAGAVPCRVCCDAHAVAMARRDGSRRRVAAPDESLRYTAALAGREPADALTTTDRARLVAELHAAGWTDVEIAVHTRMSTHTTTRIRERIGLPINTLDRLEMTA